MAGTVTRLPIVLASASPRRTELLRMIGVSHEVMPTGVDESVRPGELPLNYVERVAREKAASAAAQRSDALVIAADTTVVLGDVMLAKPDDAADAARMLRILSGREHIVYSAVALVRNNIVESAVERADVTFRELDDADIEWYVSTGEPMDKAGSYGIQGYGSTIVAGIRGDFYAVMGLPLGLTVRLAKRLGVGLLGSS